jgi:hypothetical protein
MARQLRWRTGVSSSWFNSKNRRICRSPAHSCRQIGSKSPGAQYYFRYGHQTKLQRKDGIGSGKENPATRNSSTHRPGQRHNARTAELFSVASSAFPAVCWDLTAGVLFDPWRGASTSILPRPNYISRRRPTAAGHAVDIWLRQNGSMRRRWVRRDSPALWTWGTDWHAGHHHATEVSLHVTGPYSLFRPDLGQRSFRVPFLSISIIEA